MDVLIFIEPFLSAQAWKRVYSCSVATASTLITIAQDQPRPLLSVTVRHQESLHLLTKTAWILNRVGSLQVWDVDTFRMPYFHQHLSTISLNRVCVYTSNLPSCTHMILRHVTFREWFAETHFLTNVLESVTVDVMYIDQCLPSILGASTHLRIHHWTKLTIIENDNTNLHRSPSETDLRLHGWYLSNVSELNVDTPKRDVQMVGIRMLTHLHTIRLHVRHIWMSMLQYLPSLHTVEYMGQHQLVPWSDFWFARHARNITLHQCRFTERVRLHEFQMDCHIHFRECQLATRPRRTCSTQQLTFTHCSFRTFSNACFFCRPRSALRAT